MAKGEGAELGAEALGTGGSKAAEALAHAVGEGAGAGILEHIGHALHSVMPWVGTGLAATKVVTTGLRIRDLKKKLDDLQKAGTKVGATTGRKLEAKA